MKKPHLSPWDIAWLVFAALYFLIPLYGTAEFSLETGVGKYGFDAYQHVVGDTSLQQIDFKDTFPLSLKLALATVLLSIVLMVPTVYWIHLKLPRVRPVMDFIATLPLVIPPITLAVGILQLFQAGSQQSRGPAQLLVANPSSWLLSGPQILALSYVILALPFTYRSLDAGMRAIDLKTLTEAGQSMGASWFTVLWRVILPNLRFAILASAFLTVTLVMGEYTMASIMLFNTFPTFMFVVTTGGDAHQGAALAIFSLLLTWAALLGILLLGRKSGRRDAQVAGAR
jgi:putative spermidine/putrescine transport system permease protein